MANKRFIDFPIATTVGDNDIILIWQGGANKQTTKATILSGVPDSLNDLTDVTISGLTNGQILRYDSVTGQWENTDQGNLDLNDLNDVTIVSPTNGQVLVYNSSTSKWENSSGGYVPYVGAVTTVDLGLQGLEAGYVRFDTSIVSVPDEQGLMYWDSSRSTVALIMNGTLQHIGQDTFFYVKNSSGSSIPKGTCVRFAGTDGASGHLLITPFLANGSVPSNYFLGVTAETITNGSFGQVMHFGELEGINTSSYTAGDLLYASTTVAGAFQTTAPVAPNNIVLVAAAVNSKNNGAIVVRPTYGSNINNDEGVKITSPTTGDLLQLQADGLWENKTIDAAGIVTKATNQTITGVKTFSQDIVVNGVNVGRGGGNRTENTSTGNSALSANTTGSGNTANGSFALFKNTSGGGNTALGTQSLTENTTGSGNTGLGWGSLYKNTSGSNNSALGNLSLYENTTGQTNVGIGFYALFKNTTGSDNTALGYTSGAYIADGSTANSISNNSIYIGAYTKALANNQTNQIVIGHNAIGGGSNTVVIGNSSILSNRFFGTMRIGTINNGVGDFITTDSNGVLTKRTGAEVRTDIGAGTVTSVAALTLGTSGTDLSSTVANGTTTPVITLNVPTASATNRGALSAADWTTFNNKQNALTNPVTGTGTTNYLPKFTGSTTIGNSQIIDNGSQVGIGINPQARLQVFGGTGAYPTLGTNVTNSLLISRNDNLIGTYFGYAADGNGWIQQMRNDSATAYNLVLQPVGGNVLIGTPSDNGARLQVSGTSTFSSFITAQSIGGSGLRIYGSSGTNQWDMYLNGANLRFSDNTGTGSFVVDRPATFSSSVQAVGTMFLQRASGGASTTIQFKNEIGNNRAKILFGGSVEELGFYAGDGSVPNLTISQNGSVGIGTATPAYKLVVSNSGALGLEIDPTSASGGIVSLLTYNRSVGAYKPLQINSEDIRFQTGLVSEERMRIFNDGNVLIQSGGTFSNNGARLQVSGTATFSSSITASRDGSGNLNTNTTGSQLILSRTAGGAEILGFRNTGSSNGISGTGFTAQIISDGNNALELYTVGGQPVVIGTSATPRLTIASSGNVGIGTPSPAVKLNIVDTNPLVVGDSTGSLAVTYETGTTAIGQGGGIFLGIPASSGSFFSTYIKSARESADGANSAAALVFGTRVNGGSNTERMRITSNGNVGIGTPSPERDSGTRSLAISGAGSLAASLDLYGNARNYAIFTGSAGSLGFFDLTAGAPRMTITSGGKVLIGTETDAAGAGQRLQVTTSTSGYIFSVNNTRNVSGDLNSLLLLGNNANNTSSYYLVCSMGSGDKMYVYGNGNVVNVNNSYGTLSDIALKENIKDATPKLEDILKLKVRNFNLIGSEEKQIGFIAQELEKIFPKMVDVNGINKMKSIKTSVLLPMLVKAIQELKQEIDTLKS